LRPNVGWFQVLDQELLGDQTCRINILLKRDSKLDCGGMRLMLVLQLELRLDHTDVYCLDQNPIILYIRICGSRLQTQFKTGSSVFLWEKHWNWRFNNLKDKYSRPALEVLSNKHN
jgi:hypothetical protein